jgi:phosphatidylinositol alpha-1,6-mannosyltransferase
MAVERLASKCADMHLFVSDAELSKALRHRIAPESKLRLVGQGVDFGEYSPTAVSKAQREELLRTFGLDPRRPIVGTVARLVPHKGVDTFLRAAQAILKIEPNAQFLVVGGGGLSADLESLSRALGIRQSVTFTGFLTDQECMPAVFSIIDVFCLPTRKEGFGVVFAEAMAMAKPTVASDIAPVNAIVERDVTGFLAPPEEPKVFAESVLRLLGDPELRARFGIAGRERAHRLFSEGSMLDRVSAVFQELELAKFGPHGAFTKQPVQRPECNRLKRAR